MFRSVASASKVVGVFKPFMSNRLRTSTVSPCVIRFYANKGNNNVCKPPRSTSTPDECSVKPKSSRVTSAGLRKPDPDCSNGNGRSKMSQEDPPCDDDDGKNKYKKPLLVGLLLAAVGALAFLLYGLVGTEDDSKQEVKKSKKSRKIKPIIPIPASSADIPSKVPYLLIGGGTASFSAFRAIKSNDPKAKVLVVSTEGHYPYMRPPLSKEVWFYEGSRDSQNIMFKQWNGTERSIFYEPEDFYVNCKDLMSQENGGVALARGWRVKKLDVIEKKAYLEDGYEINYDKCLIATGSSPKNLSVFEEAGEDISEKVMLYRDLFDFQNLDCVVREGVNRVAIVGGGFLGSELACALARYGRIHGFEVSQIFKESGNMGKVLPEYLSDWTTCKVQSEGVSIFANSEVQEVSSEGESVLLHLSSGETVKAEQVIVAVGAKPNTDLAETSNLELDEGYGGFTVNAELMARSNLWVAGDCASFHDIRLGRRRVEHHDHAVVTGRLAGENMTGAGKPYTHQSMFWSDLGPEVGYEAIGIVDAQLPTVGVFSKGSESDTPKGIVSSTDNVDRAESEAAAEPVTPATSLPTESENHENFNKGVIFYLKDDIIVGILLWNLFNRMSVARQVLKTGKRYEDMNEVAKLFNIHDES